MTPTPNKKKPVIFILTSILSICAVTLATLSFVYSNKNEDNIVQIMNKDAKDVSKIVEELPNYNEYKDDPNVVLAIESANDRIETAKTEEEINKIIEDEKQKIQDAINKAKEEKQKELINKIEISIVILTDDIDNYSDFKDNDEVKKIVEEITNKIKDASSKEEVDQIVSEGKKQISEVVNKQKTEKELQEAKDKTINEIIKEVVEYDIYKEEKEVVVAFKDVKESISNVEKIEDLTETKSQSITKLENAIYVAKERIKALNESKTEATENLTNEVTGLDEVSDDPNVTEAINNAKDRIESAKDEEEITQIIEEEKEKIQDAVNKAKELNNKKETSIETLTDDIENYSDLKDDDEVKKIVEEITNKINDASSQEEVDQIVSEGKKQISEVVNKQKTEKELQEAKEKTINEIIKEVVEYDTYKEEKEVVVAFEDVKESILTVEKIEDLTETKSQSITKLEDAINVAKERIKALNESKTEATENLTNEVTGLDEVSDDPNVTEAINNAKDRIESAKDEEEITQIIEEEKEKIQDAVNKAKELNNKKETSIDTLTNDIDNYSDFKNNEEVKKIVEEITNKINDASSKEEVDQIVLDGKKQISEVVNKQKAAKELQEAKASAINNLTIDVDDYEKFKNVDAVKNTVNSAKDRINSAKSIEEIINTIVPEEKAKIIIAVNDAKLALEQAKSSAISTLTNEISNYDEFKTHPNVDKVYKQAVSKISSSKSISDVQYNKNSQKSKIINAVSTAKNELQNKKANAKKDLKKLENYETYKNEQFVIDAINNANTNINNAKYTNINSVINKEKANVRYAIQQAKKINQIRI